MGVSVGMFRSGGGWKYSFSISKHLRDSFINLFGKKGNFLCVSIRVGGVS